MTKKPSKKAKSQRSRERALLKKVHLNAPGIDVGVAIATGQKTPLSQCVIGQSLTGRRVLRRGRMCRFLVMGVFD
jgi:hypothetical protein